MRTALDSSVILLIQRRQPGWEGWRQALTQAATEGLLLICPVVFAECSTGFPSLASALAQFSGIQVQYDPISPESAYFAGQTYLDTGAKGDRAPASFQIS